MISASASGMSTIKEKLVNIIHKQTVMNKITSKEDRILKNLLKLAFKPFLSVNAGETQNVTVAGSQPLKNVSINDTPNTTTTKITNGKTTSITPWIVVNVSKPYNAAKNATKIGINTSVLKIEYTQDIPSLLTNATENFCFESVAI